eukprot:jgi/Mesen1/7711/ME000405S06985
MNGQNFGMGLGQRGWFEGVGQQANGEMHRMQQLSGQRNSAWDGSNGQETGFGQLDYLGAQTMGQTQSSAWMTQDSGLQGLHELQGGHGVLSWPEMSQANLQQLDHGLNAPGPSTTYDLSLLGQRGPEEEKLNNVWQNQQMQYEEQPSIASQQAQSLLGQNQLRRSSQSSGIVLSSSYLSDFQGQVRANSSHTFAQDGQQPRGDLQQLEQDQAAIDLRNDLHQLLDDDIGQDFLRQDQNIISQNYDERNIMGVSFNRLDEYKGEASERLDLSLTLADFQKPLPAGQDKDGMGDRGLYHSRPARVESSASQQQSSQLMRGGQVYRQTNGTAWNQISMAAPAAYQDSADLQPWSAGNMWQADKSETRNELQQNSSNLMAWQEWKGEPARHNIAEQMQDSATASQLGAGTGNPGPQGHIPHSDWQVLSQGNGASAAEAHGNTTSRPGHLAQTWTPDARKYEQFFGTAAAAAAAVAELQSSHGWGSNSLQEVLDSDVRKRNFIVDMARADMSSGRHADSSQQPRQVEPRQ